MAEPNASRSEASRVDAEEKERSASRRDAVPSPEPDDLESRVFALVCRQVHSLCGRYHPEYDDIVQIAAEQALRALPSFRGEAQLSTFTYRISYRAVSRHRRWYSRWLRRFTLEAVDADAALDVLDASGCAEERERALRLHAALEHLSVKRRAVVVMRDLEGMDLARIAEIVGTGEATVRSRLRDARRDLVKVLAADPYFATDVAREEDT